MSDNIPASYMRNLNRQDENSRSHNAPYTRYPPGPQEEAHMSIRTRPANTNNAPTEPQDTYSRLYDAPYTRYPPGPQDEAHVSIRIRSANTNNAPTEPQDTYSRLYDAPYSRYPPGTQDEDHGSICTRSDNAPTEPQDTHSRSHDAPHTPYPRAQVEARMSIRPRSANTNNAPTEPTEQPFLTRNEAEKLIAQRLKQEGRLTMTKSEFNRLVDSMLRMAEANRDKLQTELRDPPADTTSARPALHDRHSLPMLGNARPTAIARPGPATSDPPAKGQNGGRSISAPAVSENVGQVWTLLYMS
jgi:hypothetical protein